MSLRDLFTCDLFCSFSYQESPSSLPKELLSFIYTLIHLTDPLLHLNLYTQNTSACHLLPQLCFASFLHLHLLDSLWSHHIITSHACKWEKMGLVLPFSLDSALSLDILYLMLLAHRPGPGGPWGEGPSTAA